jgi:beta-glucosidase
MDNYEWSSGTAPRFGLAATDFATQERSPRPAAAYFADVCKSNALPGVPTTAQGDTVAEADSGEQAW